MKKEDIRWLQRFDNYQRALHKFEEAVRLLLDKNRETEYGEQVNELMTEGLIQRFEYTHELAWKLLKDYAEYQGYTDIRGSRDAFRKAFAMGLIDDPRWMESIEDRNLTSHHYDDDEAAKIVQDILSVYYPLFNRLETTMLTLATKELKTGNI